MSYKPKKDIEYVSKVEKAIKDKYGEEATINPRSLWNEEKEREYLEQAKENAEKYYETEKDSDVVENDGIFVSKKLLTKKNSNSCPICKKYLTDISDSVYILKWDACKACYIKWIEDREQRWKNGWRPSREEDKDE
jgi:hypothetical protein